MAHWRLVTPRLVRAVHDAGGELYVWTVDDAAQIRRLEALGVDRRHHQRPAALRSAASRQVAALKPAGSAPTLERWPPR